MPLIRTMTPVDLRQVCQIEKSIHLTPWGYEIFHHCFWLNYRCRVMVLTEQSSKPIIGYCISRVMNKACHILNIGIDVPHQRSGFARQLLDELINEVGREKVIDQITLEVRPSNIAAIKLYQQYGFYQTGIKEHYYKNGDGFEDALILTRQLKK